jgi:uncharacterized protein YaiI (UPF0178 family)
LSVSEFKFWIDADACPKMIKEIIFKASIRKGFPVCLVANCYLQIPNRPNISMIQVEQGPDKADEYIEMHVAPEDIVVTADIPLAAKIIDKKATAINPRGELYTTENVRERLSVRDFMQDLRDSGMDTGGPPPLGNKDKERFANALDRLLARK